MKAQELTDKQLKAVSRNCRQAVRLCEGCLMERQPKCKTQVKDEMIRRFGVDKIYDKR